MLLLTFLCALNVASPSAALARDVRGVVMAWEDNHKISVARLDGHGAITGPVRTLGDNASAPSIAPWPSDSGFTIAWMEEVGNDLRTVYSRLDGDLNADAPKQLALMSYNLVTSPVIVRSNAATTWLSANAQVWELRVDGTLSTPLISGLPASDMIANQPFPRLVASTKARTTTECVGPSTCVVGGGPFKGYCLPECQVNTDVGFALKFMSDFSTVGAVPFTFESDAQPAMQGNGGEVVIAWQRGAQQSGGFVVLDRFSDFRDFDTATQHPLLLGTFQPDSGRVRPDIATDGTRYLVVWQYAASPGSRDIHAALVDASGRVTPYTIAATDADELRPSVIAVRSGSFLVAYEKIRGTDRQIVRQFITLDGKARAVR